MMRVLAISSMVLATACAKPRVEESPWRPARVDLHARDAIVHGEKLRYEPEPHKNTLGYWTNPVDWAQWKVRVKEPGIYTLHVLQGCGAGQGGSLVSIALADETITFAVEDTGHFQNFRWRRVGEVSIPRRGEYSLEVRPVRLANRAVMDLRQVLLVRAR